MKTIIALKIILLLGTTAWSAANPPQVIDFGYYIQQEGNQKQRIQDDTNHQERCDEIARVGNVDNFQWWSHLCQERGKMWRTKQ